MRVSYLCSFAVFDLIYMLLFLFVVFILGSLGFFLRCCPWVWNPLSKSYNNYVFWTTVEPVQTKSLACSFKFIKACPYTFWRTNSDLWKHYTIDVNITFSGFTIVFICDLFVSRDDPLMGTKTFTRTEQLACFEPWQKPRARLESREVKR